jgi:hypothetical protein
MVALKSANGASRTRAGGGQVQPVFGGVDILSIDLLQKPPNGLCAFRDASFLKRLTMLSIAQIHLKSTPLSKQG